MKKLFIILGVGILIVTVAVGLLLLQPEESSTEMPTHACGTITTLNDPEGPVEVNDFAPSENVYAKGSGMLKNQEYKIYIITDTIIVDGMAIPEPITTPTTVMTDEYGRFSPALIWSTPLTPGGYDIIADCQNVGVRGYYDSADAIDDEETHVTAGFFVIAEVPLGTIAVLFAGFTAVLIKRRMT